MILIVSNLNKSYRNSEEWLRVLRGVDISVAAGESVALTGESGSGKSTLLHLIAGLDQADSGEIWFGRSLVSKMSDGHLAELRRNKIGLACRPSTSRLAPA